MKKIIFFIFIFTFSLFGMEKPEYIKNISESEYDKGDYTVSVEFHQGISDDGTLGVNFIRLANSLKYAQTSLSDAKWVYVVLVDESGEQINGLELATKLENINTEEKNEMELYKEIVSNGNILANKVTFETLHNFIKNNYIPRM
ncbi:hypothetical protein [Cetobacterium sp.]|uniref:hypothetical protein n=1 Tax=Cetobacterium sp. TaxID=2071632 RepID=UPI003F2CC31A